MRSLRLIKPEHSPGPGGEEGAIDWLTEIIASIRLRDVLDILIVSFVIYRIILFIKGTRTARMLIGFAIIIAAFFISQQAELLTFHWILNNFLSSIILVLIIVFQDDIRKGLAQVGRNPFLWGVSTLEQYEATNEVAKASLSMAEMKIGALIVMEREMGLRDYVELGIPLDAQVTKELLQSIFVHHSPIHDGAVIISNGRIIAAGCWLPLSKDPNVPKSLGTRHRAAIGLTEQTDSVVVVVSEETGKVSVVVGGEISEELGMLELRQYLQDLLGSRKKGTRR